MERGLGSSGKTGSDFSGKIISASISNGVKIITEFAFKHCKDLESIVIPDSVVEIEQSAFFGCKSLKSVTIPNSVTHIGEHAFSECSSLESVTILKSGAHIGRYAFSGCSSLKSVIIPDSIVIDFGAFKDCNISDYSSPCLTIKNGFAIKDKVLLYPTKKSVQLKSPMTLR